MTFSETYIDQTCQWFGRVFTIDEIREDLDNKEPELAKYLAHNKNIIRVNNEDLLESQLIHREVLARKLNFLGYRCGCLGLSQLSRKLLHKWLAQALGVERTDLNFDIIIGFASDRHIISGGIEKSQYVLNIARVLCLFPKQYRPFIPMNSLSEVIEDHLSSDSQYIAEQQIRELLSYFPDRVQDVITSREGLFGKDPETLEAIARRFHVTRERIRQIHQKFWRGIVAPISRRQFVTGIRLIPILALIQMIKKNEYKIIFASDNRSADMLRFVSKCLNIDLSTIGSYVLLTPGFDNIETRLVPNMRNKFLSEPRFILRELTKVKQPLTFQEATFLISIIQPILVPKLRTKQRLYLTLRQIGNPAHYSAITEVHNRIFPQFARTTELVHVALTNCKGMYGIEWAGIQGVYGLKKWGIKRSRKNIFIDVKEIVQDQYEKTGQPVAMQYIYSEMLRRRSSLRQSSFKMSCGLNPFIKETTQNCFVPKEDLPDDSKANDQLDKVLAEFDDVQEP